MNTIRECRQSVRSPWKDIFALALRPVGQPSVRVILGPISLALEVLVAIDQSVVMKSIENMFMLGSNRNLGVVRRRAKPVAEVLGSRRGVEALARIILAKSAVRIHGNMVAPYRASY